MSKEFVCPKPNRWHQIYQDLVQNYNCATSTMHEPEGSRINKEGGPPIPLILNGWVYSTDFDKMQQWKKTIEWADKHDLLHLIEVREEDKHY